LLDVGLGDPHAGKHIGEGVAPPDGVALQAARLPRFQTGRYSRSPARERRKHVHAHQPDEGEAFAGPTDAIDEEGADGELPGEGLAVPGVQRIPQVPGGRPRGKLDRLPASARRFGDRGGVPQGHGHARAGVVPADARAMAADAPGLSRFTQPMQDLVARAADLPEAEDPAEETYWVSTADPRLVNGVPTKNPRYLQVRPDIANPKDVALADLANHLFRDVPLDESLRHSVDVVAAGRRNNPPEDGVPPLCAYNPLHYMELPELFMEFISSMTGKSPSTTGAGSEGALTKSPFNALPAIYDLNAALLSYALSGYDGWLSSAGYIGPKVQVAHDISLLIPEIFSRMSAEERDAHRLVEGGYLEHIEDFEYEGRTVQASRLGYRMNQAFASTFFGRIFLHPDVVFTEEMLRPELQDEAVFADSVDIIVTTHKVVAEHYRADGSIEWAVPPLRALLEIMIDGTSREGWDLTSPEFRALFERENILSSSWYAERLDAKVARDTRQAQQAIEDLTRFYTAENNEEVIERLGIEGRLAEARAWLDRVSSPAYREHLVGTLGLQPSLA